MASATMDMMSTEIIRRARLGDAERVWRLVSEFATSFTPDRAAFEAVWPHVLDAPGTLVLSPTRRMTWSATCPPIRT
jgi:hypothetical protein